MTGDYKTTITGIVTALVTLAAHFNLVVPDTWQSFAVAAGVLVMGLFAKDAKQGI
jgi:hypothetical protein